MFLFLDVNCSNRWHVHHVKKLSACFYLTCNVKTCEVKYLEHSQLVDAEVFRGVTNIVLTSNCTFPSLHHRKYVVIYKLGLAPLQLCPNFQLKQVAS